MALGLRTLDLQDLNPDGSQLQVGLRGWPRGLALGAGCAQGGLCAGQAWQGGAIGGTDCRAVARRMHACLGSTGQRPGAHGVLRAASGAPAPHSLRRRSTSL